MPAGNPEFFSYRSVMKIYVLDNAFAGGVKKWTGNMGGRLTFGL